MERSRRKLPRSSCPSILNTWAFSFHFVRIPTCSIYRGQILTLSCASLSVSFLSTFSHLLWVNPLLSSLLTLFHGMLMAPSLSESPAVHPESQGSTFAFVISRIRCVTSRGDSWRLVSRTGDFTPGSCICIWWKLSNAYFSLGRGFVSTTPPLPSRIKLKVFELSNLRILDRSLNN